MGGQTVRRGNRWKRKCAGSNKMVLRLTFNIENKSEHSEHGWFKKSPGLGGSSLFISLGIKEFQCQLGVKGRY